MKAAVLTQFNTPLHIQELDVPSPDYGQVLVKIHSSGICGAQLGQIGGTKMREEFLPCLMGHEGGGEGEPELPVLIDEEGCVTISSLDDVGVTALRLEIVRRCKANMSSDPLSLPEGWHRQS